ncbi:MAG: D-alanine--D-alanine ligase [Deltaproteobacteria bacterium]|nr:D-alanine--D-alanine ligase [Deltaproteobacteria bacterium]
MSKLRVALIFGGKSGEHEVSIVSAMSIYKALDKNKYDVTLVAIDKSGRWVLPDSKALLSQPANVRDLRIASKSQAVSLISYPSEMNLIPIEKNKPHPEGGLKFDVILPILHGTHGEDGTVQGLFELADIPYVGSGVLGSALCMDKDSAKRVMRDAGIPVVPFMAVRRREFSSNKKKIADEAIGKFGLPFFVKPSNMGSSVGVHKAKTAADVIPLLEDAFRYDTKILVERAVSARELEVAVLGNHDPEASVVGEIIPRHEFYSYEAKYIDENGADLKIPAENLPRGTEESARELAVRAFRELDCAGMARADFFLDKKTGELFLNELNTIPGFTSISMYPKLWEASGIPYPELLDRLIELALERHREREGLKTTYEPAT